MRNKYYDEMENKRTLVTRKQITDSDLESTVNYCIFRKLNWCQVEVKKLGKLSGENAPVMHADRSKNVSIRQDLPRNWACSQNPNLR